MKKSIYIILLLIVTVASSCNKSAKREADISDITFDVKIERFDSAFWNLDTLDLEKSFHELAIKYPEIAPIYTQRVIQFGHPDSAITHDTYRLFRKDTSVQHLYTDVLKKYTDIKDIEKELTLAFRRAKYFFPSKNIPHIFCHVSGFNQNIIVGKNFISLSLDNYMGEDYDIYKKINIYKYQLPNMCRQNIVPDYLSAWITSENTNDANGDLLNDIIYYGKILYTISVLLPEKSEQEIMGYTDKQWKWAQDNEANMWNKLVMSKDLYNKHPLTKNHYTHDGPFTKPFSQDSPGRAGRYLGWQIVKSYMRENQEITVEQLLHQKNAQFILKESNYQP